MTRFSNYSARTPVSWLDHASGTNGLATPAQVIQQKGIYRGNPKYKNIYINDINLLAVKTVCGCLHGMLITAKV